MNDEASVVLNFMLYGAAFVFMVVILVSLILIGVDRGFCQLMTKNPFITVKNITSCNRLPSYLRMDDANLTGSICYHEGVCPP